MNRLTARISSGPLAGTAVCPELYVHGTSMEKYDLTTIQAMIDKLARFEDLEEQGKAATPKRGITCHVCNHDFRLVKKGTHIEAVSYAHTYRVQNEQDSVVCDAADCPQCGCQNLLGYRLPPPPPPKQ